VGVVGWGRLRDGEEEKERRVRLMNQALACPLPDLIPLGGAGKSLVVVETSLFTKSRG